jgi:hypothetical protein
MENDVQFYQNGHVTLVNPDPSGSPSEQLAAAVRAAEEAEPVESERLGAPRFERKHWALRADSGVMTRPQTAAGAVLFSNNTFDRRAELEDNCFSFENSHPAKEFFFLASSDQPDAGLARGWICEGFNLVVPDRPIAGGGPLPAGRFSPANLLLPAGGAQLKFTKFNYSSGSLEFEQIAHSVSDACQIYLAAGWKERDVVDKLAVPVLRSASDRGAAYGYSAVTGTVMVPAAALRGADGAGRLPVPLLMNLSYEPEEERHSSLSCVLRKVDPRALASLRPGRPYPLVLSAVNEGVNGGGADDAARESVGALRALVSEVEGDRPGDDEEIAQEIARAALADECGPHRTEGVFALQWTQLATASLPAAAAEADGRLGRIAARVREIILLAAAVRAVRLKPWMTAYELYLEWSREGGAP